METIEFTREELLDMQLIFRAAMRSELLDEHVVKTLTVIWEKVEKAEQRF